MSSHTTDSHQTRGWFDRLLDWTGWASAVMLAIMMLSTTFEVVMRYFVGRPTIWAVDVTTIMLVFVTLLSAAWTLRREGHIKIDVVTSHLPPKAVAFLDFVTSIIALIACLVLTIEGVLVTLDAYRMGENLYRALSIPKPLIVWVFPFGGLLLSIQFMRRILKRYRDYRSL
jgi:C4-dicarboxylate transporter DctQ subunit